MNSVSVTQQQYVKQKKRQIQLLKTIRILILIAFLMVWELATNLHYIDGFFFS
ncbi:ABC transporter permease, partial [bacterium 1XD42-8]